MGSFRHVGKASDPRKVVNEAGGIGFKSGNALDHLIMTAAIPSFNEPTYYVNGSSSDDVFSSGRAKLYLDGLDENAREIIRNIVVAVQSESDPKDVLRFAAYLRNECKVRTMPQIILAICSHLDETKAGVSRYARYIFKRPDDLKEAFMAFRCLFSRVGDNGKRVGTVSHSLRKAIGNALAEMSERDIMKYRNKGNPSFGELVRAIYGTMNTSWKNENANLLRYLTNSVLPDDGSLPVIRAWHEFHQTKEFDDRAKELIEASGVGWEEIISHYGKTGNALVNLKVWDWISAAERLVESNGESRAYRIMPYMATLRNLRNFEKYGISKENLIQVAKFIADNAANSKQLPMRFYSALKETKNPVLTKALHDAMENVVDTLPILEGTTLIGVDTSGSMSSPLNRNSSLNIKEVACLLGGLVYRRTSGPSIIGAVASQWSRADVSNRSAVMDISRIVAGKDVGAGTMLSKMFDEAHSMGFYPDRVVLLTDGQSWMENSPYGFGHRNDNCQSALDKYRERGFKGHLHEVHMVPYRTSASKSGKNVHIYSCYSEELLRMIYTLENGTGESGGLVNPVNVEEIKKRFRELYAY